MKSWLYYFLGAGVLSGAVVFWKLRHKFLKNKFDNLKFDYNLIERLRKTNKDANTIHQKVMEQREEQIWYDLDNGDFWSELRDDKKPDKK